MNQQLIYLPCFAMFTLHTIILFVMLKRRVSAIREKKIKMNYFKTYSQTQEVPELALQAARNYTNLTEGPILFYAICIFGFAFGKVDITFFTLACLYVIARIVHSIIHTSSNSIIARMRAFAASWFICYIMAIKLLVAVISF